MSWIAHCDKIKPVPGTERLNFQEIHKKIFPTKELATQQALAWEAQFGEGYYCDIYKL